MPVTSNRTYWPSTGGAIAFKPSFLEGQPTAQIFINLGLGTDYINSDQLQLNNMNISMVSQLGIQGLSGSTPFSSTVCLPHVPLAASVNVKSGDLATIQLIQLAVNGDAMYSVDVSLSPYHHSS
jgi:hypothetical protein